MDIYVCETVKRRVTYIKQTNQTKYKKRSVLVIHIESELIYLPFESNIPHTNEIDLERLKLERHLIVRISV